MNALQRSACIFCPLSKTVLHDGNIAYLCCFDRKKKIPLRKLKECPNDKIRREIKENGSDD